MSSLQNDDFASSPTISGRKIVVAMFAMGFVATGILWVYWDLHMMPFMPLQEKLAAEFQKSSPRVDGGQRKMHKGTPMILRIVMRVPFDPTAEDATNQDLVEQRLQRTQQLAEADQSLPDFELLEIHLFHEDKEKTIRQKTFLKELTAAATPGEQ